MSENSTRHWGYLGEAAQTIEKPDFWNHVKATTERRLSELLQMSPWIYYDKFLSWVSPGFPVKKAHFTPEIQGAVFSFIRDWINNSYRPIAAKWRDLSLDDKQKDLEVYNNTWVIPPDIEKAITEEERQAFMIAWINRTEHYRDVMERILELWWITPIEWCHNYLLAEWDRVVLRKVDIS